MDRETVVVSVGGTSHALLDDPKEMNEVSDPDAWRRRTATRFESNTLAVMVIVDSLEYSPAPWSKYKHYGAQNEVGSART